MRKVDVQVDATTYPAIERTLIDGIEDGTSEPTIMHWTFDDDLFLSIGPVEDAALLDTAAAEEHDLDYARRYNVSGGTGIFRTDHTPTLYAFFPDPGEGRSLTDYIDIAGEAMADALADVGVDRAYYDGGGDIELEPEDGEGRATKVGVSGAGYQEGVWGVFANIINKTYAPEEFGVIDEVVKLPKEKFEDKDTDSIEGRMGALRDEAPDADAADVLDTAAENMAAALDATVEPGSFTDDEQATIDEHADFFGSAEWFEHYSTRDTFADAADDDRVAEVAYKARKLVKVSLVVDPDDHISEALYTGDMYHRPGFEAIDKLADAIEGHDIHDEDAIRADLAAVLDDEDVEVPWMDAHDFLQPVIRAQDNLTPVSEFERE